jgi:hypothetical protein
LERGAASARIDPVVSDDEPDVMVEQPPPASATLIAA